MKLLLTSSGLSTKKISKEFLKLIDKPIKEIKVLFIPTASRTKGELKYVKKSKEDLLNLGILNKNIKEINLNKEIPIEKIKNFDVIYVCGGNTFYLLKKIRESKFDKTIKEFVKLNKLYFGISAGSIIVNPNITPASTGLEPDKNDVNITDLTGLNLTNFLISPHYCKEEKEILKRFKKNSKYKVILLKDNQAISITDKKIKIIK